MGFRLKAPSTENARRPTGLTRDDPPAIITRERPRRIKRNACVMADALAAHAVDGNRRTGGAKLAGRQCGREFA